MDKINFGLTDEGMIVLGKMNFVYDCDFEKFKSILKKYTSDPLFIPDDYSKEDRIISVDEDDNSKFIFALKCGENMFVDYDCERWIMFTVNELNDLTKDIEEEEMKFLMEINDQLKIRR